MDYTHFLKDFFALFAIVEPIGAIPIFLALTGTLTKQQQISVGWVASITSCILLVLVAVLGTTWLTFFGVSLNSFMIGGGIILLILSINMLTATTPKMKSREEEQEALDTIGLGVVPLGIPLLAGPASISHVVIQTANLSHSAIVIYILVIISIAIISGITFRFAHNIKNAIGTTGLNVITRIMGLILAAIAVETIATGVLGTVAQFITPLVKN